MQFSSLKASNDWDKLRKTTFKAITSLKIRCQSTKTPAKCHSVCYSRAPTAINQDKCQDLPNSAKVTATEAKLNKAAHPNQEIIDNQINQISELNTNQINLQSQIS